MSAGATRRNVAAVVDLGWSVSPWAPAPKPHRASDVTPAFVTSSFGVPGAQVESLTDLDGTSGTTDRRRLAVSWNATGTAAELPSSVFVKSTPLTAKNRAMVGPLSMAVNEVRFYDEARPQLPADVAPIAYATRSGRGARHLLLLEDLVARGAQTLALSDDCDLAHARGVVTALAQLHAAFWDSPRFATDLGWLAPQTSRPGFALLGMTFRRVRRSLLSSTTVTLSAAVRDMATVVNQHDKALYAHWLRGPQTFLHGDSHLGNTYRLADGTSGLLDWQVVHRGPGLREVSYFLGNSVPIELRREHEADLLRLYLATLAEAGVPDVMTFEQAWDDYRFFLFDAWDSAAICVLWPGLQTAANVEASFARANAAVDDHHVADVLRRTLTRTTDSSRRSA
ncbi:MAG: hypothetical protein JWP31_1751 [Aeromicrobium sp.]|nr:hypothetical protein [Aeromicrobium sp.]